MANWLAALGAGALAGSEGISRNRELRRREGLDKIEADRIARALSMQERGMGMQEEQLGMQRESARRERGKEILDLAGPNSVLDDTAEQTVREGGMGFRLEPGRHDERPGIDPVLGTSARVSTMIGARVIPTSAQQSELEERGARAREISLRDSARAFVSSDAFWTQPHNKQAAAWGMTGYGGNVPQSIEQVKELAAYENKLAMQRDAANNAAGRYDRASGSSARYSPTQLWHINRNVIEDNIRQRYSAQMNAAAQQENPEELSRYEQKIQQETEREVARQLGPMPGGSTQKFELLPSGQAQPAVRPQYELIK